MIERLFFQIIEQFTAAGRSVRCGEAIREEFAVYTFFVGRTQEDKFSSLFFPGIVNGLEFFDQHTKFPGGKTVGAEEVLDRASERVKVIIYTAKPGVVIGKGGSEIEKVKKELQKYTYPKERVEIVPATEIIETGEPPVNAIRHKKDSSIVVGMKKVRCGEADAFVSSGSTGAVLVGGQTIVGRIKGVERPPLAPLIPTKDGVSLLIDCGANVDARPSHLVQFAMMGSIYMEHVVGIKNPRVGIVNIGVEEEKGNALVKETYPLLKENPYINFVGSIEAREIPNGAADVVVCEAFVGNVILKLYEGVGATLISKVKQGMMTSLRTAEHRCLA